MPIYTILPCFHWKHRIYYVLIGNGVLTPVRDWWQCKKITTPRHFAYVRFFNFLQSISIGVFSSFFLILWFKVYQQDAHHKYLWLRLTFKNKSTIHKRVHKLKRFFFFAGVFFRFCQRFQFSCVQLTLSLKNLVPNAIIM